MKFTVDTTVVASKDLAVADLGSEAVLLDPATGQYFGLNEVAVRVVELAQEKTTLSHIVDVLLGEFEVEEGRLTSDIVSFTEELARRGLIHHS